MGENTEKEEEVEKLTTKAEEETPMLEGGLVNDFRKYIGEARSQGACGSCWAFAAIAAIEGRYAQVSGGKITNFSDQHLVDCDDLDGGCRGGYPTRTLTWIRGNGVVEQHVVPYRANKGVCKAEYKEHLYKILPRWLYSRNC